MDPPWQNTHLVRLVDGRGWRNTFPDCPEGDAGLSRCYSPGGVRLYHAVQGTKSIYSDTQILLFGSSILERACVSCRPEFLFSFVILPPARTLNDLRQSHRFATHIVMAPSNNDTLSRLHILRMMLQGKASEAPQVAKRSSRISK